MEHLMREESPHELEGRLAVAVDDELDLALELLLALRDVDGGELARLD